MFLQTFFLLIMSIACIHCQESIKCGETKAGNGDEKEEVRFTFNALNDYEQVYLEGCQSTHDIWLEIEDSTGDCILVNGECKNRFAGDITIPGDVKRDEQYTFVVKGYGMRHGYYSVTLVCEEDEYSPYPPSITTQPSTSTTTESPTSTTTRPSTSTTTEPLRSTTARPSTSTTAQPSTSTEAPTSTTTEASTSTTSSPTPYPTQQDDEECSRIRKPWHKLTESETNLYVNGFRALKQNGKLDYFTQTHGNSKILKHGNAVFLPWHRYFIWELETQFRNLGGEYECFGLPYWDWSYDIEKHDFNVAAWEILKGLGGAGNKYNNYCVENDGWDTYTPYYSDSDNCLRRKICGESGESSCSFTGQASALHSLLTTEEKYGDDDKDWDYRYRLAAKHDSAHLRIGGKKDNDGGHLGDITKSADDPIFYLLHAFVDFQYALWQDCRNHELVSKYGITPDMYDGSIYELDSDLPFGTLSEQQWAYISTHSVTVRDMHSIQDWGVIYDKGDYFERAKVENDGSICEDKINPEWFKDITGRRRLQNKNKEKYASDNEEYSHDVFAKISTKYRCDKSSTIEKKAELYKTWAQMDCQFLTIGNNCERPKYFDDCSDIEPNRYVEGTGQFDIDITLEELKSKVADYPCMIDTRETYYSWARQVGNLKGLARGDYDIFCDHAFVSKQPAEQKCAANQVKKGKRKGKGEGKGNYNKW